MSNGVVASDKMDRTDFYQQLFAEHEDRLGNLDVNNPKLIVGFGGVPGAGKTTLAQKIERKFQGVRVSKDQIRGLIDTRKPKITTIDELNDWTEGYHQFLLAKLSEFSNGLLVLDSSLDRSYQTRFDFAEEHGYPFLVVDLNVPKSVAKERIQQSKDNPEDYLDHFDAWWQQHKEFQQAVETDITLDSTDDYGVVFDEIADRLTR